MSDTQVLVLTVTFLLAAAIMVPLTWIAYKKEKKRKELEARRASQAKARARKQQQAEMQAREHEKDVLQKKRAVQAFEILKDRFRTIRHSTYTSPSCSGCAFSMVHIADVGTDTGVITGRCVKCGMERRIYALSKDAFLAVADELDEIMDAYEHVQNHIPEYPGLAVSFPEPSPLSRPGRESG